MSSCPSTRSSRGSSRGPSPSLSLPYLRTISNAVRFQERGSPPHTGLPEREYNRAGSPYDCNVAIVNNTANLACQISGVQFRCSLLL